LYSNAKTAHHTDRIGHSRTQDLVKVTGLVVECGFGLRNVWMLFGELKSKLVLEGWIKANALHSCIL
jgi:hypothetical protein